MASLQSLLGVGEGWHPLLGRLAPLQIGLGLQGYTLEAGKEVGNHGLKTSEYNLTSELKRLGLETFLEKAFMDKDNRGTLVVPTEVEMKFLFSVQWHLRSAGSRTTPVPSLKPRVCFNKMETTPT